MESVKPQLIGSSIFQPNYKMAMWTPYKVNPSSVGNSSGGVFHQVRKRLVVDKNVSLVDPDDEETLTLSGVNDSPLTKVVKQKISENRTHKDHDNSLPEIPTKRLCRMKFAEKLNLIKTEIVERERVLEARAAHDENDRLKRTIAAFHLYANELRIRLRKHGVEWSLEWEKYDRQH